MTTTATPVGDLHVEILGSGPPAVLWHSLFVDSGQWDRVRPALSKERTLVLVDGPGHGRSGPPPDRFTLDDCAAAAARALAALDLPAVDWLGNAWGGHVGLVAAARYPGLLRSLVSVAAPIAPLRGAERLRVGALVAAYRLAGPVPPLANAVVEAMLAPEVRRRDPQAVHTVRDAVAGADRRAMVRAMRSAMLGRPDLSDLLDRIGTPTLFLAGDDDPLYTLAHAAAAAGSVADGRSGVISGSRHLPPLENPAAFTERVLAFWATCATPVRSHEQERP